MDEVETKNEEAPKVEAEQPRKIVLGRKVIRQFVVKSGIQTGAIRCSRSDPP
jgi:hypothetical protein